MSIRTIYGDGLKPDAELDSPHPLIQIKTSVWEATPNGQFHYSGRRPVTVRQAIELESQPNIRQRPSAEGNYDARTLHMKLVAWLRMWLKSPRDAARLPFIDRHPPMVWWDYDDSDDWATKRWQRALIWHAKD